MTAPTDTIAYTLAWVRGDNSIPRAFAAARGGIDQPRCQLTRSYLRPSPRSLRPNGAASVKMSGNGPLFLPAGDLNRRTSPTDLMAIAQRRSAPTPQATTHRPARANEICTPGPSMEPPTGGITAHDSDLFGKLFNKVAGGGGFRPAYV